jgi:hypothetical protein
MSVNFDIQSRADALERKLDEEIVREYWLATGDYWIALFLMLFTVVASVSAGLAFNGRKNSRKSK